MEKRGSLPCKYLIVTPGSSRERGHLWVPSQIAMVHDDPFGRKFKMTKSDKLFLEMEHRFRKSSLKTKTAEDEISFLSNFKELHENRRSQTTNFAPIAIPYPAGPCHTIQHGDHSRFCVTRKLY